MSSFAILAIHCALSTIVFALLARWYVMPRVSLENERRLLSLFLIVNVFRYLPLSLYMPGQVAAEFPEAVKALVAFGDFTSAMVALVALVLLRNESRLSIPAVWLFSVVSILDIVLALWSALSAKVYELSLGANYFTVVVYVPLLMVVQVLILHILYTTRKRAVSGR